MINPKTELIFERALNIAISKCFIGRKSVSVAEVVKRAFAQIPKRHYLMVINDNTNWCQFTVSFFKEKHKNSYKMPDGRVLECSGRSNKSFDI